MADGDRVILNVARLAESAGGDPDLMRELVELYLEDSEARIPQLLEAAHQGALEQAGNEAHGLKGASASMGCEEAAAAFKRVEELGRSGDAAPLDEAIARAQAAWRRACERLREVAA
jgi:HPt (histidine-containing phosphotransfer) domain-containing protein